MIQRIQSIYLLISGFLFLLLTGSILFVSVSENDAMYSFTPSGLINSESIQVYETLPLFVLFLIITIITFIALLLFKRRLLQIRIVIFTLVSVVLSYLLIFYYMFQTDQEFNIVKHIFRIPVLFPLIGAILLYLAFRNIRKDELLIKSLDRLR